MRRISGAPLAPFRCHACSKVLGYTSPGEAKRINVRAHVFCEEHKDAPMELTERQRQLLDALAHLRASGQTPTFVAAGEMIGVSRTRAQQIASSIRARGDGKLLDDAMGYTEDAESDAAESAPQAAPSGPADLEFRAPADIGVSPSDAGDPAAHGAAFIVE